MASGQIELSVSSPSSSEPPRLKSTCEGCVRAKVKCTGPPGPCDRCRGWRHLDCVFVEERKRGRPRLNPSDSSEMAPCKNAYPEEPDREAKALRLTDLDSSAVSTKMSTRRKTNQCSEASSKLAKSAKPTCVTSDCWSQVQSLGDAQTISDLSVPPSQGLNPDQARIVGIFFELYKNHASDRSCCKAWFARQLNKIATMLKQAGSTQALYSLIEWMNKHRIVVSQASAPEKKGFSDPDSGLVLPPVTSMKGPVLKDSIRIASSSTDKDMLDNPDRVNCSCLRLKYSADEVCTVRTSRRFVEMFGRDADSFSEFLSTLCGGILPWGADVLITLMARAYDALLLIRMLAHEFMVLPRPSKTDPFVVRKVQSSHLWSCRRSDGSTIECVVRLVHVERVSLEGVEVEVTAQFEPCPLLPPMVCSFDKQGGEQSGEDATLNDEEEDFEAFRFFPPALQQSQSIGMESGPMEGAATDSGGDAWLEDLLHWVDDPPPGGPIN